MGWLIAGILFIGLWLIVIGSTIIDYCHTSQEFQHAVAKWLEGITFEPCDDEHHE